MEKENNLKATQVNNAPLCGALKATGRWMAGILFVTMSMLFLMGQAQGDESPGALSERIEKLNLIPWPRSGEMGEGRFEINEKSRIVPLGKTKPLGRVLRGEMEALFEVSPSTASEPAAGDIVLRVEPGLEVEEYKLNVNNRVEISGGSYAGVAAGTVTFLQALTINKENDPGLPVMQVADAPHASYRGLMVDTARQFHSPETIRQIINLCRWYKIRYLHIHFTDNESFTFPSTAYPQLVTQGRHYTLEQLENLEQYASERGVVIVPEFDVPGHSGAAVQAMPELFATQKGNKKTLNFAAPETCRAVDTIIREMADVFRATPYFHIGSDEVKKGGLAEDPDFRAAMERTGLDNVHELYRKFIVDRNETVRELGKQTIVWEGFRPDGEVKIPTNILVMSFQCGYYYRPDRLVEDGYTIINASWKPLYVVLNNPAPKGQWPVEIIYDWNMYLFQVHQGGWGYRNSPIQLSSDAPVLGAQMCSWANRQEKVIPNIRKRLAAMSARVWNPDSDRDFEDFSRRLESTDERLEALLQE